MAVIPSDIRFVGIAANVDLVERKTNRLNNQTQPYTMQDIIDTVGGGGGVTSIIAGSNISIDQSTGDVTISASGGTSVMNAGTGALSIVGSGSGNTASGGCSFVGGGCGNTASGSFSSVLGGLTNTASNTSATVAGGRSNTALGIFSSILGGFSSDATGNYSSIVGGRDNTASGCRSFIGGGCANTAFGLDSSVLGGRQNTASGNCSSILGGCLNSIPVSLTNVHVIGSSLTASASDYTFVNNLCNVGGGTSDARLKENIKPLTIGLQELSGLEPVEYNFIDDESKKTKYGFLAQNVQAVMPSLITYHPTDLVDGEPVLQFDKDAVWSSMVNALKELKKEIEYIKTIINK